jgi:LemA protein
MNDTFPNIKLPAESVPAPSHAGKWIAGAVLVALLAGTAWFAIKQHNELQHNDLAVGLSWNLVINQYTRRSELVPNLVAVVKSYAAHETDLFEQINATRGNLASLSAGSTDPRQLAQFHLAQKQLAGQVSRLLVVAEKYPELKSSELYQNLMVQLEGTENRLAYARAQYMEVVANYNYGILSFPGSLFAARSGFKPRAVTAFADEAVVMRPQAVDLK